MKMVLWREKEPMSARVVKGRIAAIYWAFRMGYGGTRVRSVIVTDLTLATIMPMQIATAGEEWIAATHG